MKPAKITEIPFNNEKEWLNLRKADITSTACSALFGLSKYATEFEIFQEKANGIEVPFEVKDRMEKGNRLEAAIAAEVARQEGWTDLKPLKVYRRIEGERIASSFDFEAMTNQKLKVLIEIKAVDYFQYVEHWTEEEAPPHIEIQVQHELLCAPEFDIAAIVACTGIYDYKVIMRERDNDVGEAIRTRVAQFWKDVENGVEPEINYERDQDVINAMFPTQKEPPIDMTGDNYFSDLLHRFHLAGMQKKEFETEQKACKAEIHHILEGAEGAFTNEYKINVKRTKDGDETRITEDMVGNVLKKAKKGHRNALLTDLQKTK